MPRLKLKPPGQQKLVPSVKYQIILGSESLMLYPVEVNRQDGLSLTGFFP